MLYPHLKEHSIKLGYSEDKVWVLLILCCVVLGVDKVWIKDGYPHFIKDNF